jgi:GT2 family glycosyltransferase
MQQEKNLVSVIVVTYNRKDLLNACLLSLARQRDVPFEVILVDNGSTDGSLEMARSRFGTEPTFRLTIIANQENRGFCEANNQGIAEARGEFIALLNNDAEAEPDWLAALRAAFDFDANIGMAASKILVHSDPTRIDKVGHLIYLDGQNRGRGTGERDQGQYDLVEEVSWPDGCAAMYRAAMLDEIGAFDEDFFAYADDAELGLRARIAGWRCLYIPGAVVRHHRGSTLGTYSTRRMELIERNRVLLAAKLFPWSLLWLNGVYYLVRIGAAAIGAFLHTGELSRFPGWRGKLRLAAALVRADLEALRLLPKILRKRSQIRKIRKLSSSQVKQLLNRYRIPLRQLMELQT